MTGMTDEELAAKVSGGDREAFNVLVERYQSKIINMAYTMLSSREDSYDAAQEVFIRVYRNIEKFKGGSSFSTWIYRITSNTCTDMLRKRVRRISAVSITESDDDDRAPLELKDTSPTPEETVEKNEVQKAVRAALAELPYEHRQIIALYDIEGLSYQEISEIIKCPVGTVKSRLSRARNFLKKILSQNRELF